MIEFDKVTKVFPGGVKAVDDLSFEVKDGETLVLLGTSGSGKTTSMKMVNRLIEPTSGRILIDGEDIMLKDPILLRRGIGYAIQHIGLFPHMTVAENIAAVPKLLGWQGEKISQRVDWLLEMVGLEPETFRDRYPVNLSGGQSQRIGVARALAADPPIVLMDEPFGALDPITREQLQNEFIELESEIKKTVIFVTHDIYEAVKMADRIALLDAGRLQQLATPVELIAHPASEFVEQFLGQHKVQLKLLTTSVGMAGVDLAPPGPRPDECESEDHIRFRHSLIEAINVFNQTGRDRLPVYKAKKCVGELQREALERAIAGALSN